MGDNGSGNTAIVAIVVLVILAVGLAYFFGIFGGREGQGSLTSPTTVIEKPTIIEKR
ncbi:MAG TPA: hypothetical protein VGP47_03560 [Parachlamydiaceae bacterium]|nr:hypothetical protein [Parachlamydiaceae bacterium]